MRQTTNAPITWARPTRVLYLPGPPLSIDDERGVWVSYIVGLSFAPRFFVAERASGVADEVLEMSPHAIVGRLVDSDGLSAFRASSFLPRAYGIHDGDELPSPIRRDFNEFFEIGTHTASIADLGCMELARLAAL